MLAGAGWQFICLPRRRKRLTRQVQTDARPRQNAVTLDLDRKNLVCAWTLRRQDRPPQLVVPSASGQATSPSGTFETFARTLRMSEVRGRPERSTDDHSEAIDPEPRNRNDRCQVRGEEGSVPAPDRFSRKRDLVPRWANTNRRLGVSWPRFSRRFRLGPRVDLDLCQVFERPAPQV